MKIDVLTVNGSPKNITPNIIYERGVGGAELALFSWAEIMAEMGHEIHIYNNPLGNTIEHFRVNDNLQLHPDNCFQPLEDRDCLITFRGPNDKTRISKGKKIGWSCDQFTEGDYKHWYSEMHEMILISEFHKQDHLKRYGAIAEKARVLDLGVRNEYKKIEKKPYQIIFCSVPDRGLNNLADIWPQIKFNVPNAKLIITSDYTLWGAKEPFNQQYRDRFKNLPDVEFLGNVNRKELIRLQSESELHLYPCIYDENFCIANAETQFAGCFTITSDIGALKTTNFTGQIIPLTPDWQAKYINAVRDYFEMPIEDRVFVQENVKSKAKERFDWYKICEQWEKILSE